MIEKRRPDFKGMRHAHPVALVKNIVRQIGKLIEPQEVVARQSKRRLFNWLDKQLPFLRIRKSSVPEEMRVDRIEQRSAQHARDLVIEANLVVRNRQQPGHAGG